jgi:hypothetical protein
MIIVVPPRAYESLDDRTIIRNLGLGNSTNGENQAPGITRVSSRRGRDTVTDSTATWDGLTTANCNIVAFDLIALGFVSSRLNRQNVAG